MEQEDKTIEALSDYFGHLTTLSAGSIVVLATFADRLASNGWASWLAVFSVVGFVACILAGVVGKHGLILFLGGGEDFPWIHRQELDEQAKTTVAAASVMTASWLVALFSFAVALVLLGGFAIATLL